MSYSFCIVQDANVTVVSNAFVGDDLSHACEAQFLDQAFGKPMCEGNTTEEAVPSEAQRT